MPSGATSPVVCCAVAGTMGSPVTTAPTGMANAVPSGPVVQYSSAVVGLALPCEQYNGTPLT